MKDEEIILDDDEVIEEVFGEDEPEPEQKEQEEPAEQKQEEKPEEPKPALPEEPAEQKQEQKPEEPEPALPEEPEESKPEPQEPPKEEPKKQPKPEESKPEGPPKEKQKETPDLFAEKGKQKDKEQETPKESKAPVPTGAEEKIGDEPEPEPPKPEYKAEPKKPESSEGSGQHLFAIRTTVGKEATVAEFLSNRARMEKLELASFVVPSSLKGYVLVESPARDELVKAVTGIQHIRGIIQGEVDFSEITHYLEAKVVKDIPEKSLVELVSGPFKGEKAKVVRVDKSKDAITVELIEATVPIPITVKMDAVRVLADDTAVLQEADITTKDKDD